MNCPHCGSPVAESSSFCGDCGGRISTPTTAEAGLSVQTSGSARPTPIPPGRRVFARRWAVVTVGVIAVLIVAGGTFAWVSRPGHSKPPSGWLTGKVEPPSAERNGFTVIAAGHTYPVSSDGTFSMPERPDSVTALIAEGPKAKHALLAVVTSGQSQSREPRSTERDKHCTSAGLPLAVRLHRRSACRQEHPALPRPFHGGSAARRSAATYGRRTKIDVARQFCVRLSPWPDRCQRSTGPPQDLRTPR